MDKRNIIIVLLLIGLGFSLFFIYQSKNKENLSRIISPSNKLKLAFDESLKNPVLGSIAELACLPSGRFDCGLDGCNVQEPGSYYFLDFGTERGTYFRCDTKGCDNYPVKVVRSGSFTQFIPEGGQAMLFKIDDFNNEFIDMATIGTASLFSFGKCEKLR